MACYSALCPRAPTAPSAPPPPITSTGIKRFYIFLFVWESMAQKDISGRGGSRGTGGARQGYGRGVVEWMKLKLNAVPDFPVNLSEVVRHLRLAICS